MVDTRATAPRRIGAGAEESLLVPAIADSPLALSAIRLDASTELALGGADADEFLLVVDGAGHAETEEGINELEPRNALCVIAGTSATVRAGSGGILFLRAQAGPGCDRHAPLGEPRAMATVEDADARAATSERSFRILFDPSNGSTRATLFVGYVPPGRAPWHFHQYDEIVWIWEGTGRLHLQGQSDDIRQGAAFRLRPRQVHTVENLGGDDLILLGLFTPAGSPAAAYFADPTWTAPCSPVGG